MSRTPTLVSDLTSDVRLALFWPVTGGPLTNADILRIANRLLRSEVWPQVNKARGKLLSAVWDVAMHAGDTFDEPWGYPIPPECMATLESVSYVPPDGEERPLTWMPERDWHRAALLHHTASGPVEYTVRGGQVLVFPHPSAPPTGAKIRMHIVARPLKMAEHSSPNLYLELDQDPELQSTAVRLNVVDAGLLSSAWGTTPSTYDLVALSSTPPHVPTDFYAKTHVTVNEGSDYVDVAVANWTRGSELSGVPGRVANGDFIVAGYQTPIVQLPDEAYSVLLDGIVMEIAGARGDRAKFERRRKMWEDGLLALPDKLSPRLQNEPQTFIAHGNAVRLRLRGARRGGMRRGVDS